ncbi:hypothetical protein [Bacteroides sp.]|uniref:hypothetical protein n=1 Tax=Bacteroides sp. TaxID=29523 RepID=UPI0026374E3B|nr:hypothetical protein [Bacteroides sp.]MDD3039036.1 hypothetical protein [Bacteroides sp.]
MTIRFTDWGDMAFWDDNRGISRCRDITWFCGSIHDLHSIESQVFPDADDHENEYLFEQGPGDYVYEESWNEPQIGEYGYVEVPGYWDFRLISFSPFDDVSSKGGQGCPHDWILLEYIDEDGYIPPDYPYKQMDAFEVYRCRLCKTYCEKKTTIGVTLRRLEK